MRAKGHPHARPPGARRGARIWRGRGERGGQLRRAAGPGSRGLWPVRGTADATKQQRAAADRGAGAGDELQRAGDRGTMDTHWPVGNEVRDAATGEGERGRIRSMRWSQASVSSGKEKRRPRASPYGVGARQRVTRRRTGTTCCATAKSGGVRGGFGRRGRGRGGDGGAAPGGRRGARRPVGGAG